MGIPAAKRRLKQRNINESIFGGTEEAAYLIPVSIDGSCIIVVRVYRVYGIRLLRFRRGWVSAGSDSTWEQSRYEVLCAGMLIRIDGSGDDPAYERTVLRLARQYGELTPCSLPGWLLSISIEQN
ncbi:MAG: hypothetical protein IJP78_12590 [Clostridia bacterium]|nr:hypothetical protein [Clostridia bacterium]